MSQCERIVQYINQHGSISTLEAFTDLGCTRLASRITDLKSKATISNQNTPKGRTATAKRCTLKNIHLKIKIQRRKHHEKLFGFKRKQNCAD